MAGGGDERAFVVSEFRDGAMDQTYRWRPGGEVQPVEVPEPGGGSGAAGKAAVWRLAAAFLPEGFPDSVRTTASKQAQPRLAANTKQQSPKKSRALP